MSMLNFYLSLPSIPFYEKQMPNSLYIKGYTEALKFIDGVKVVYGYDSYELVEEQFRKYFIDTRTGRYLMFAPFYYIPVKQGKEHFGFILKGQDKITYKGSIWFNYFNMDALNQDYPFVVFVEGIKDCYILLKMGIPVIGMLTNTVSNEFLEYVISLKKFPIFIPDNDDAGKQGIKAFKKNMESLRYGYFTHEITGCKDFGDFFKDECRKIVITNVEMLLRFIYNNFRIKFAVKGE